MRKGLVILFLSTYVFMNQYFCVPLLLMDMHLQAWKVTLPFLYSCLHRVPITY